MYGKHPFYLSARESQDERYDRDLKTGEVVDARKAEAMARIKRVWTDPPQGSVPETPTERILLKRGALDW